MNRAEEQALEAYPYEDGVKGEICKASIPIYIQGYRQALDDVLTKVYQEQLNPSVDMCISEEETGYYTALSIIREWIDNQKE